MWFDFTIIGLWDQERKVEVNNRDRDLTTIHIEGGLDIDISRKELQEYLVWDDDWLNDRGIHLMSGLTVLVLYKEDIEYLLRNMEENNPVVG